MLGLALAGLFVYPLDEYTTVIGFEAIIADRIVTVQIKDKAKLESCQLETSYMGATVTGKVARRPVGGPGLSLSQFQADREQVMGQEREGTEKGARDPEMKSCVM